MNVARASDLHNHRMHTAIMELRDIIHERYPTAQFSVVTPPEEPSSLELIAVVDVDDTDEVMDLVLDRVLDFQMEEGLPVHVLPLMTPEREAAARAREREQNERDGDGGYARRLAELTAMRQQTSL